MKTKEEKKEEKKIRDRAKREKRKAEGVCTNCGKKEAEEGKIRCLECCAKHKAAGRGKKYNRTPAIVDKEKQREYRKTCYRNNPAKYRAKCKNRRDKLKALGLCIACGIEQARKDKSRCEGCISKQTEYSRTYRMEFKKEVMNAYGGCRCNCKGCNETILEFLQIDHINNNGAEHRRELGDKGLKLYQVLKKEDWPSGYRVLCANCNIARMCGRTCPHEKAVFDPTVTAGLLLTY